MLVDRVSSEQSLALLAGGQSSSRTPASSIAAPDDDFDFVSRTGLRVDAVTEEVPEVYRQSLYDLRDHPSRTAEVLGTFDEYNATESSDDFADFFEFDDVPPYGSDRGFMREYCLNADYGDDAYQDNMQLLLDDIDVPDGVGAYVQHLAQGVVDTVLAPDEITWQPRSALRLLRGDAETEDEDDDEGLSEIDRQELAAAKAAFEADMFGDVGEPSGHEKELRFRFASGAATDVEDESDSEQRRIVAEAPENELEEELDEVFARPAPSAAEIDGLVYAVGADDAIVPAHRDYMQAARPPPPGTSLHDTDGLQRGRDRTYPCVRGGYVPITRAWATTWTDEAAGFRDVNVPATMLRMAQDEVEADLHARYGADLSSAFAAYETQLASETPDDNYSGSDAETPAAWELSDSEEERQLQREAAVLASELYPEASPSISARPQARRRLTASAATKRTADDATVLRPSEEGSQVVSPDRDAAGMAAEAPSAAGVINDASPDAAAAAAAAVVADSDVGSNKAGRGTDTGVADASEPPTMSAAAAQMPRSSAQTRPSGYARSATARRQTASVQATEPSAGSADSLDRASGSMSAQHTAVDTVREASSTDKVDERRAVPQDSAQLAETFEPTVEKLADTDNSDASGSTAGEGDDRDNKDAADADARQLASLEAEFAAKAEQLKRLNTELNKASPAAEVSGYHRVLVDEVTTLRQQCADWSLIGIAPSTAGADGDAVQRARDLLSHSQARRDALTSKVDELQSKVTRLTAELREREKVAQTLQADINSEFARGPVAQELKGVDDAALQEPGAGAGDSTAAKQLRSENTAASIGQESARKAEGGMLGWLGRLLPRPWAD